MDRRSFIIAASGVVASSMIAGCTRSAGSDDTPVATERVVRDVPRDGDRTVGDAVTETSSPDIAVSNITFQRAGQKGLLVAGDLRNASDREFEAVEVVVTLYDENEAQDALFDSTREQETRESLASGSGWQWAATFRDDPLPNIDYFAVTARGYY